MQRTNRALWVIMRLDAQGSFAMPVTLILAVPVLAVLDVPDWVIATIVLTAAVLLGGFGLATALMLGTAMARGDATFPDDRVLRYVHLGPADRVADGPNGRPEGAPDQLSLRVSAGRPPPA